MCRTSRSWPIKLRYNDKPRRNAKSRRLDRAIHRVFTEVEVQPVSVQYAWAREYDTKKGKRG